MKLKKLVIASFVALQMLTVAQVVNANESPTLQQEIIEENYYTVLQKWRESGIAAVSGVEQIITPNMMEIESLVSQSESQGYQSEVVSWENGNTITLDLTVEQAGLYEVYIDYYTTSDGSIPLQGELKVNNEIQYFEQRNLQLPSQWENSVSQFESDENGNQKVPDQIVKRTWQQASLKDSAHLYQDPMKVYLNAGENNLTFTNSRGSAYIGNIIIKSEEQSKPYSEYLSSIETKTDIAQTLTIEAENYTTKNQSYLLPQVTNNASVVPFETGKKLLNTFGGTNWSTSGQSATWEFDVPETGVYEISLKVLQNFKSDTRVFRDILIDGKILFEELNSYPFDYSTKWQNITLGNETENFKFYLPSGKHTITLVADASNMNDSIQVIGNVKTAIEQTTLDIKKLTGNQLDASRQWDILEYLPELPTEIESWVAQLEQAQEQLMVFSSNGKEYPEVVSLKEAITKLKHFMEKPNDVPKKLADLSEGTGSITQKLVTVSTDIQKQPLVLDRMYIHGANETLPNPEVGLVTKMTTSVQAFFGSFLQQETKLNADDPNVLDVWVNRPRQYVDVLQEMIDSTFTAETGIQVKLSIMPDESKLILANAANSQPDVALGVSTNLPYELAVRGAAVDLSQFPDFQEYIDVFAPGSLMSYIVNDKVYGLPETLDFYVMFYREDILNELGIEIPSTWDDVLEILPELQRFGMNFYTPLAGAGGFKPFMSTAPYIYQSGGDLYSPDGMSTAINSEEAVDGMKFMTDLFTVYSMPLQVGNFYNSFRYGTLPIGISNFSTYIQLTAAAPEIAGLWDIAAHPGIENEAGEVERWATGSAQSVMMFEKSEKQEQGWEFLKWWMDTETQVKFAEKIQTLYGPTYMWNTANLDAFTQLPWEENDKDVILEQWDWLIEVPKSPGSYMLERELSNVWNEIVFDGENPRAAVDDAVIKIDREFKRKLEEFGYLQDGELIKPYQIPTIELVEGWVNK
ncbi:MAG: extracellular solute-binding protein [Culicoidibacterales bacterium]